MCKSEVINKHYVGTKGYSAQSLLRIDGVIEEYTSHLTDIVYIKFSQGMKTQQGFKYDTTNTISLMMNTLDLRALVYAMKEIARCKSNDLGYEKITKSATMKKIVLGYKGNPDTFYINVAEIETSKKIGISFNKWDFVAFADSLNLFAEMEEKFLHQLSRQKKRQNQEK